MNIFMLAALVVSSLIVEAGDKVGNGGDVISCPDEKMILLDLYQGKEDWGFEFTPKTGLRSEILHQVLQKFYQVDSFIANKLLTRSLEIEKELSLLETKSSYRSSLVKLTGNLLVNIPDEGVAELPIGCEIVQAATQIQSPFPGEVKFTFQKTLWNQLDAMAQSSLILHEVIYEHMISSGELFSRSTRYFNAALHAGQLDSVKGYLDVSSLFNFKNLNIELNTNRFFGEKKSCSVIRRKYRPSNSDRDEGTSVFVNGRNIVSDEPDLLSALLNFHSFARRGFCD